MKIFICFRCLRASTKQELILGKYKRINNADTSNMQFCPQGKCKGDVFMFGDMEGMFVVLAVVCGVVGWGVIEFLIWLCSFIHISFG